MGAVTSVPEPSTVVLLTSVLALFMAKLLFGWSKSLFR